MHTMLEKILKRVDEEDSVERKVLYVYSYPKYAKQIMEHILRNDLHELPA